MKLFPRPARLSARLNRLSDAFHSDNGSSILLGAALMLSLVLAGLTIGRMIQVERDIQPALDDSRRLGAALEATRVQLRDGRLGSAEARIARADSQAQRFHRIAATSRPGAEQRARMLSYDDAFGQYYVAARRAAAGISMSADADGSSAEDAALGYAMLRAQLAAGMRSQTRAIDAARPATAPVELAGWLALTLLSTAALLRRAASRRSLEGMAQAPRSGRHEPARTGGDTPVLPLRDAVARLARTRLAASVAASKLAKRNNDRQIELASTWNVPLLSIVPAEKPMVEMDVYEDEPSEEESAVVMPKYERLTLVTA